jgi:deoxycytidylate deaminase
MHKYLRIASHISVKGNRLRRALVGAVGQRSDGTIVQAWNGSSAGTTYDRCPSAHAEARLLRKLDAGSTVYVARTRKEDGKLAIAKPCKDCERLMRHRGVKRVEYSINDNEYGVLEF